MWCFECFKIESFCKATGSIDLKLQKGWFLPSLVVVTVICCNAVLGGCLLSQVKKSLSMIFCSLDMT